MRLRPSSPRSARAPRGRFPQRVTPVQVRRSQSLLSDSSVIQDRLSVPSFGCSRRRGAEDVANSYLPYVSSALVPRRVKESNSGIFDFDERAGSGKRIPVGADLREPLGVGTIGFEPTAPLTPSSHEGQRHAQARLPWSPSSLLTRVKESTSRSPGVHIGLFGSQLEYRPSRRTRDAGETRFSSTPHVVAEPAASWLVG